MALSPTDQCIVLPFRPGTAQAFNGTGLALHFLLGKRPGAAHRAQGNVVRLAGQKDISRKRRRFSTIVAMRPTNWT
jgi:hypothetical protein